MEITKDDRGNYVAVLSGEYSIADLEDIIGELQDKHKADYRNGEQ